MELITLAQTEIALTSKEFTLLISAQYDVLAVYIYCITYLWETKWDYVYSL